MRHPTYLSLLFLSFFFLLVSFGRRAIAADIKVSALDSRIVYVGQWTDQDNGGHEFAGNGASASLTFQGTAVQWLSAKNPNGASVIVSVDGEQTTIDQAAGTQRSDSSVPATLFTKTGLDGSKEHTIQLQYGGVGAYGGPYMEVYGFIYTEPDASELSTLATFVTTTASTTSTTAPTPVVSVQTTTVQNTQTLIETTTPAVLSTSQDQTASDSIETTSRTDKSVPTSTISSSQRSPTATTSTPVSLFTENSTPSPTTYLSASGERTVTITTGGTQVSMSAEASTTAEPWSDSGQDNKSVPIGGIVGGVVGGVLCAILLTLLVLCLLRRRRVQQRRRIEDLEGTPNPYHTQAVTPNAGGSADGHSQMSTFITPANSETHLPTAPTIISIDTMVRPDHMASLSSTPVEATASPISPLTTQLGALSILHRSSPQTSTPSTIRPLSSATRSVSSTAAHDGSSENRLVVSRSMKLSEMAAAQAKVEANRGATLATPATLPAVSLPPTPGPYSARPLSVNPQARAPALDIETPADAAGSPFDQPMTRPATGLPHLVIPSEPFPQNFDVPPPVYSEHPTQ